MVRHGVDLRTLMLLARWESEIIMRYVKETPLEMLTQTYINGQKRAVADVQSTVEREVHEEKLGLQIQELAENHERQMKTCKRRSPG